MHSHHKYQPTWYKNLFVYTDSREELVRERERKKEKKRNNFDG